MIDIKFLKENPEVVKQNIKNKFQDRKLPLVDEVIELDRESRAVQTEANAVRATRNKLSKQIGALTVNEKVYANWRKISAIAKKYRAENLPHRTFQAYSRSAYQSRCFATFPYLFLHRPWRYLARPPHRETKPR